MAEGLGLLFKIRADASQATGELAAFQASTKAGVGSLVAEYKKASAYTADNVSATDLLIRESEKAIANSQKVALGASQALRNTSKDLEAAAKGASALGGIMSGLLTTAGIAAGYALMSMAKEAFNAAGQLFDLSQKTNVSVETLSALKNAGQTSGVEIAGLSTALGILQKNMAAAHDPTSKQAELFKRLKIDIDDTEGALRTSFRALAAMGEGYRQTDAAMQLFGRSGKDVLAIIKETNGDLDGAIAKYKEMGTLISTETAKAADELGDSLTAMGQSAKATALELLTGLAPAFKVLIGIGNVVITIFKGVAKVLNDIMGTNFRRYYENLANIEEKLGTMAGRIAGRAGRTTVGGVKSILPGFGAFVTSSENAAAIETDIGGGAGSSGRARGGGRGGGASSGAGAAAAANREARELERANLAAMKEAAREADAIAKTIERMAVDHQRSLTQIAAVYSKARIAQLRDDAQEGKITYLQAETAITAIIAGEFNKRAQELQKSIAAEKEGTEEYQRLTDEYGRLQAEAATFKEESERRKRDALRQTIELEDIATTKAEMRARGGGEQEDVPGDVVGEGVEKTVDYSGKKKVPDFTEHINAIQTYKDAATSAWSAISQGFGDMVYGFLMGEKMSGKAFMAMAKSAIAAVAAQAAVQALFELGMGLASLWWNPPKAALHFAAAKTFALVAAVAGVASLAIPGGGGATASAAGGNQTTGSPGGSTKQGEPTPIDRNRTAGEIRVSVNVTRDSGSIVNAVVEDFRRNGRTRQVIGNDGQLATA